MQGYGGQPGQMQMQYGGQPMQGYPAMPGQPGQPGQGINQPLLD